MSAAAPRLFVDQPLAPGVDCALPADVVRHVQVLRLQEGARLTLFNGRGGEFAAVLSYLDRKSATARIVAFDDIERELPYRATLAQGIASNEKMDWLIEKSVELGVSGIAPLTCAKSVVRLVGERATKRQQHWAALVRAAAAQCGRNRVPEVAAPLAFQAWLDARPPGALGVLLTPRAPAGFDSLPRSAPAAGVTLLIGPEAGLSDAEEAQAIRQGMLPISAGPRILRTETAGIAVLAVLAARWGGW